jgi:hypothetical protein
LAEITEADLARLVEDGVAEGRDLEYKRQLPGNLPEDRREFLADVSSFTNCVGGDIVYGVIEEEGEAKDICGIDMPNPDGEILRLENLLRDSIQPRIQGIGIQPIPLSNGRHVLIARMARSWARPHVVTHGGNQRFCSRNSRGKYPLDVNEIRSAFMGNAEIGERIRNFRLDRMDAIASRGSPVTLVGGPQLRLHIVPFTAFEAGAQVDIATLSTYPYRELLAPVGAIGFSDSRHNFDGFLTYSLDAARAALYYLQVFRNGAVESSTATLFGSTSDRGSFISKTYEGSVIEATERFFSLQERLGVDPPLAVMLSLIGVKGYHMDVRDAFLDDVYPIDRDRLLVPEVIATSLHEDVGRLLRPAFDTVWNAAGWPRSLNYDDEGNWRPRR